MCAVLHYREDENGTAYGGAWRVIGPRKARRILLTATALVFAAGTAVWLAFAAGRGQSHSASRPESGAGTGSPPALGITAITAASLPKTRHPSEATLDPSSDERWPGRRDFEQADDENTSGFDFGQAVQEFESLRACRAYFKAAKSARRMPSAPLDTGEASAEVLENLARRLDGLLATLEAGRKDCESRTRDQVRRRMFHVSLELGLRSYRPAQSCFVQGLLSEADPIPKKTRALRLYRRFAPQFMDQLLNSGDVATTWLLVKKMSGKVWQQHGGGWPNTLPNPDPYRVYRALRLLYYRVEPPERKTNIEYFLAAMASKYRLSDKQLAAADEWAQRVYAQHFAQQPLLRNPWSAQPCG